MSINKYNSTSGELEPLSQQRMWIGTEAEYNAAVTAGTIGTDMLVYITDDEEGPTDVVQANNKYAVQSDAVAKAFTAANSTLKDSTPTNGSNKPITSDGVYDFMAKHFLPVFETVNVNTSIDLNNVTTGGFANFLVSPTNAHSCGSYGYLLVLRYGSSSSPNLAQVHIPYHGGDAFAIRCRFGGTWTAWKNYGVV